METVLSSFSNFNNAWSAFYCCMVKQKLGLNFWNGFLAGALFIFLICSGIVEIFFVSKDVFKLNTIYIDRKLYKLDKVK